MLQYFIKKKNQLHFLQDAPYYCVHSHYRGANPVYVVTDLDILKQVMVKEFSHFVDRQVVRTLDFNIMCI